MILPRIEVDSPLTKIKLATITYKTLFLNDNIRYWFWRKRRTIEGTWGIWSPPRHKIGHVEMDIIVSGFRKYLENLPEKLHKTAMIHITSRYLHLEIDGPSLGSQCRELGVGPKDGADLLRNALAAMRDGISAA